MKLELKYCSMWSYEPKAVSLASLVLSTFKQKVSSLTLVPSGGGCFELSANGVLLYSKLKTGEFPDEQAMIELLATKVK